MTLRAASLLGANIDAALQYVVEELNRQGVPCQIIENDDRLGAVESGRVDLMWMCGMLAANLLEAGTIDARVVAAPIFEGAPKPTYRSVFVVRHQDRCGHLGDLAKARWVFNEADSWSGHQAARVELARRGLGQPLDVTWSSSHQESLRFLREGKADLTPIDESLWRWVDRSGLAAIGFTDPWPSPPLLMRSPDQRVLDTLFSIDGPFCGVERIVPSDLSHLKPIAAHLTNPRSTTADDGDLAAYSV